jgi:hypothetical protein
VLLTLEEIAPGVTAPRQRTENALTRDGRVLGTVAVILPEASIGAVLPFGPAGRPPSDAFIVAVPGSDPYRAAARVGRTLHLRVPRPRGRLGIPTAGPRCRLGQASAGCKRS